MLSIPTLLPPLLDARLYLLLYTSSETHQIHHASCQQGARLWISNLNQVSKNVSEEDRQEKKLLSFGGGSLLHHLEFIVLIPTFR